MASLSALRLHPNDAPSLACSALLGAVSIALSLLSACSIPEDPKATMYVIMEPERAETFLVDLSAISMKHGLEPNVGGAVADTGDKVLVVESTGRWLRIWAQNMPLSPGVCGDSPGEVHSDPGQFIVSVYPAISLLPRARATALAHALAIDFRAMNYRVMLEPAVPCSAAVLHPGSQR
jgi:hypothetical protein